MNSYPQETVAIKTPTVQIKSSVISANTKDVEDGLIDDEVHEMSNIFCHSASISLCLEHMFSVGNP